MHILFIAPRYHTNQHYWVKALKDAGHSVSFWVRKKAGAEEYSLLEPRLVEPATRGDGHMRNTGAVRNSGHSRRRRVKRFSSLLETERPDAVVVRNPGEPFGKAALRALHRAGIPVVLYSQRPLYYREARHRRLVTALLQWRMSVGRDDRYAPWITPVRGDRRPNAKTPPNWHHIPFVMEPDPVAEQALGNRTWCPDGVRRVIMVAKYMARKNHLLLVRALHELSSHYPVSLELVGGAGHPDYTAVRAEVEAYIHEHKLDWVTLTPSVRYAELQEKMRDFDLFVLPSRNEAVGVSLLEAMGKGLPVVCSTTTGARDYVEHGGNGRIFQSDSLSDLRDQLHELLADPANLPAMGRRSLELVRTVHSPQAFLERFTPLLRP